MIPIRPSLILAHPQLAILQWYLQHRLWTILQPGLQLQFLMSGPEKGCTEPGCVLSAYSRTVCTFSYRRRDHPQSPSKCLGLSCAHMTCWPPDGATLERVSGLL